MKLEQCLYIYNFKNISILEMKQGHKEVHDDYKKYIIKKDKTRSNYYNYYTTNKWGQLKNFDLTLNSDLGLDEVANIIANVYLKGNFQLI